MFAFEIPGMRFSLPAGEEVARYRFVAVDSNSTGVVADTTATPIGVSMNKATAAGQVLEIADGLVIVEAAEAITAGGAVSSDANGRAVEADSGIVAGIAVTGATAAGMLITVKM